MESISEDFFIYEVEKPDIEIRQKQEVVAFANRKERFLVANSSTR